MSAEADVQSKFPCALTIDVPLPDHRLASIALQALQVDAELSPLVHRSFSLVASGATTDGEPQTEEQLHVLRIAYRATTNRMLRVSVNGFMESLGVVLHVMQELDVNVLAAQTQPSIQT